MPSPHSSRSLPAIAWLTTLPNVIGAPDDCTPAVANGMVYIEGVTSSTFKDLPPTGAPVSERLFALRTPSAARALPYAPSR